MSAVPKRILTAAEYLRFDRSAEYKSEFVDGEIFPIQGPGGSVGMAGARFPHNLVKDNLAFEVRFRLKGTPCILLTSDMRVKIDRSAIYSYPDIVIICGQPVFEDEDRDTLLNPQIIVEVLSDSTQKYDRGRKFKNYMRIPSLREYVLVEQDEISIDRYERQANGNWTLTPFLESAADFEFATIPVRIPMADIYRGVDLAPKRQTNN